MKGSMDRVRKGGPWTWGPCFVYVPFILLSISSLLETISLKSGRYFTSILRGRAGHEVIDNRAKLVIITLYPAIPSRIIVLLKTPGFFGVPGGGISASVNFGFCWPFFSELQKCFQFALLLTRSLTILGREGI